MSQTIALKKLRCWVVGGGTCAVSCVPRETEEQAEGVERAGGLWAAFADKVTFCRARRGVGMHILGSTGLVLSSRETNHL